MTARSRTTIAVGTIGVFFGFLGAAFFNLAGLDLRRGGFEPGLAWEEGESEYGVFFGCVLLLFWLISVVGVVVLSRTGHPDGSLRVLGIWVAVLCTAIVMALVLASVAVLPRAYG